MNAPQPPDGRHVCTDPVECLDRVHGPVHPPGGEPVDHAAAAADHLIALAVAADPAFPVTPAMHDAAVALMGALVSALTVGGVW